MGLKYEYMIPMLNIGGNFEQQDTFPAAGESKARFFRNQEKLKEISVAE
jgi:hypothetical protein